MKMFVASLVLGAVLAGLCSGMPADLEPEFWFSTSVHPDGPPGARTRRASGSGPERPLNPVHVPSSVCVSMSPSMGHNSSSQNTSAPYTYTFERTSIHPGDVLNLRVSGTEPFKGIYIQARDENEEPVGTFLEHDNSAVVISDCAPNENNALSYVSRTDLNQLDLQWRAPNKPGKVVFKCTFVKSFKIFWDRVMSEEINIQ